MTERYIHSTGRKRESLHVDSFIEELKALMFRYQLSIGHEDQHGGFIIEPYDVDNVNWISEASIDKKVTK